MKVSGNEIRQKYIIEHNGKLWYVVKAEAVKPGKGPAYAQVEMKCITDGTKLNERFRASESVERVFLEENEYQYLYTEQNHLVLMDQSTFEQIQVDEALVGESKAFLQEGMTVKVSSYEGLNISIRLPDTVILEITEAEPVVKGQTASSSFKPAVLENGVRIMVPPHIESGNKVVVNTDDATYVERAKG